MIGCLILPSLPIEAELRRRPELAGRPVALHDGGRLSALSPQAEAAGLKQEMTLGQAAVICPEAVLLPYYQDLYQAAQEQVLRICADYSPAIEPVSLRGIFLEMPKAGPPEETLAGIARAVTSCLSFTSRTGGGAGKLVARIAALERPGTVVAAGDEPRFLAPLPISRLWMADERTRLRLEALGLSTIGLLQRIPESALAAHFGPLSKQLKEWALGIDRSPVRALYPPAAAAARLAFAGGVADWISLSEALENLSAQVCSQLQRSGRVGSRLALEVETEEGSRVHECELHRPLGKTEELFLAAQRLLAREPLREPVTGLRLEISRLERCRGEQVSLWEHREERRRERLIPALAAIRRRFGSEAAGWAHEIEPSRRERMLSCLMGEERWPGSSACW